jgi:membrane protease YdiL (CAAX protease family)
MGLATILWLLIRRDKSSMQPVPIRSTNWLKEILMAVAIMLAEWCLQIAVGYVMHNIGVQRGTPLPKTSYSSALIKIAFYFSLFFLALYEEILFRVYLQSKLQSLLGGRPGLSIVISAALFSAVHRYSLPGSIAVFVTGAFYGVLYQTSRKVPRLVLAHWIHNLLAMSMT